MKKILFPLVSLMMPGFAGAGMKDGPCQHWDQTEPDPYCASFLWWLPQYDEDFDISKTQGRYSVDCSTPGDIELSGMEARDSFKLVLNGQPVADAEMVFSYYGNQNHPVTYLFGVMSENMPHGITVNGDQGGFYVLEDTKNGRRLSQCVE